MDAASKDSACIEGAVRTRSFKTVLYSIPHANRGDANNRSRQWVPRFAGQFSIISGPQTNLITLYISKFEKNHKSAINNMMVSESGLVGVGREWFQGAVRPVRA